MKQVDVWDRFKMSILYMNNNLKQYKIYIAYSQTTPITVVHHDAQLKPNRCLQPSLSESSFMQDHHVQ